MIGLLKLPPITVFIFDILVLSGIGGGATQDRESLSGSTALNPHVTAKNFRPGFFEKHNPDLILLADFAHCPIFAGLIVGKIVIHNNNLSFTVYKHP
jgi:hypothetical protein